MKMCLAINLVTLFTITLSCSTSVNVFQDETNSIINSELERNITRYKTETAYLSFNQNDALIEFLSTLLGENFHTQTLESRIGKNNFDIIFNDTQLNYLITQLNQYHFNYNKLKLEQNIILLSNLDKDNYSIDDIENFNRIYVFLSYPVYTKNKDFSIISFANGIKGEMQGGISIYKKENNKWKFITTFNDWIE